MTKRIDIPQEFGGGWVELRDSLSFAQRQRLDTAGTTVRRTELGVVVDQEIDMYEHFIATVEAYVAGWSLPVEANRTGIESDVLTEEVGEWLFEQIKEHRAATQRSKSGAARLVS